ncbi:MAG: hypothetical protein AAGG81_07840 [Chlamydiota bacterium]
MGIQNLSHTSSILDEYKVNQFVDNCKNTSSQVLKPEFKKIDGKKCHFIGTVPITNYKVYNRKAPVSQNRKLLESTHIIFAYLATIFGGYAISKISEELKQSKFADQELTELHLFTNYIRKLKEKCPISDLHQYMVIEKLENIAEARDNIFTKIRRKANITVALLVVMATSSVIAITGSIFGAWSLMTVALCCVAATGVILVSKWLLDSADKGHEKSAEIINNTIKELNELKQQTHH